MVLISLRAYPGGPRRLDAGCGGKKGTSSFLPPVVIAVSLPVGPALRAQPCFLRFLKKKMPTDYFNEGKRKYVILGQMMEFRCITRCKGTLLQVSSEASGWPP
jgi:hypothetical protein